MMNGYQQAAPSVQKAVRQLIEHYQVYFVGPTEQRIDQWLEEYINVPAWHHTIYTYRRDLLYGDFLIERKQEGGKEKEDRLTTVIEYGSDTFKTWDDIMEYFGRLGGQ